MNVFTVANQVNGKDKVARFLQYLCRTLWYTNQKVDNSLVEKFKALENHFSFFRKFLRFGKSIESFQLASKSVKQDDVIKRLAGLIKVVNGCYLFCDHIVLLCKLNLIKLNANEWTLSANRYWFLTDVLNLVQNYLELKRIYLTNTTLKLKEEINIVLPVYLDIIKNFCDIFIPLCSLNVVNISPGISGLLGMISSLIGFLMLLKPFSKAL